MPRMAWRWSSFVGLLAVALQGCAGGALPPASTAPAPKGSAAPTSTAPATAPATALAPPPPRALPPLSEAVPPAPASCREDAPPSAVTPEGCGERAAALAQLAGVLALPEAERARQLLALEACAGLPVGFVTALRAELAPLACADELVQPSLTAPDSALSGELRDVLIGLGLAARLSRLATPPPRPRAPLTKASFLEFRDRELFPWVEHQYTAIGQLSLVGSRLSGYGKAVVAVEAGLAELRFVSEIRDVPLPDELARDPELRDVYYGSLDQALEPRKARGRDAALVGLRGLAEVGVLADARLARARALLSRVYGGARLDALDALLLPALPALPTPPGLEVEASLAQHLPTYYAGFVFGASVPAPAVLRRLLDRGVPYALRRRLEQSALDAEQRHLVARMHVAFGQQYFRAEDFERAAALASEAGAPVPGEHREEYALLRALGRALRDGPRDAVALIAGAAAPRALGSVAELEVLAAGRSKLGPLAEYDAALLLSLAPPQAAEVEYWKDVAERFERAARGLVEPGAKQEARARAKAARDTAKAIRDAPRSAGSTAPQSSVPSQRTG